MALVPSPTDNPNQDTKGGGRCDNGLCPGDAVNTASARSGSGLYTPAQTRNAVTATGGAITWNRANPTLAYPPPHRDAVDAETPATGACARLQHACPDAERRQHFFSHSPSVTANSGAAVNIASDNSTHAPSARRVR